MIIRSAYIKKNGLKSFLGFFLNAPQPFYCFVFFKKNK